MTAQKKTVAQPILKVQDLGYQIDGQKIIEHISFDISTQQIITIIGPNGAGKSSLLKLLINWAKPSSGQIIKKHGLKIGYVPQNINFNASIPMTIKRFLSLHQKIDLQKRDQLLKSLKVDHLIKKSLHELSGGERQKILIIRALLANPDLLLLDEPLQGLDVPSQMQIITLLDQYIKDHLCGILMVSHDLHLVMARTDYVICMNHHICCQGHPESISTHPEYIALFGQESENLAVYHHHHDHTHDAHD